MESARSVWQWEGAPEVAAIRYQGATDKADEILPTTGFVMNCYKLERLSFATTRYETTSPRSIKRRVKWCVRVVKPRSHSHAFRQQVKRKHVRTHVKG